MVSKKLSETTDRELLEITAVSLQHIDEMLTSLSQAATGILLGLVAGMSNVKLEAIIPPKGKDTPNA